MANNSLSGDLKSLFPGYLHLCKRNVKIQSSGTIWHGELKKKKLYINSQPSSHSTFKNPKTLTLTDPPFQTFQEIIIHHGGKTSKQEKT
jgi:hypothetical protein